MPFTQMGETKVENLPAYLDIEAVEAHLINPVGDYNSLSAYGMEIMPGFGVIFKEAYWNDDQYVAHAKPTTIIVPFHNLAAVQNLTTITVGREDLDDWQSQLTEEYQTTFDRYLKLDGVLTLTRDTSNNQFAAQRDLMEQQKTIMADYLNILRQRANVAGIKLTERNAQ